MRKEFFLNVKDMSRNLYRMPTSVNNFVKWSPLEMELNKTFLKLKDDIHAALCDNIDTRTSLENLRELVSASNLYIRDKKSPNSLLLHEIAVYITKMLIVFGAISEPSRLGFPLSATSQENNTENAVLPYLEILAEFRDKIRADARQINANVILQECDKLRDDTLPNLGVRLEDREGGPSAVKIVGREVLLKEKEMKKLAELEKLKEKERKKAELAAMQAAKEAQKKIPPSEMFKLEKDKYSKFDEMGIPTHDIEGKEISKGQMKKLIKLQQAQEKKYQEFLSSNS